MRRSWTAILLLLSVAGAATGFYVLRNNKGTIGSDTLRTIRPERRMIGNIVNATGPVRLRVGSEVRVGSQLSGIVRKLNVTAGSHVRAGEVIAQIDDAPIRARLSQADAQVELDRAGLQRTQVNYERVKKLAVQGLVPL